MIKSYLYDQLSVVSLYGEIKREFENEITMLFESVLLSNEGNFSFIALGAKEQIQYIDNKTIYTSNGKEKVLDIDPFRFLKEYYKNIDFQKYKEISNRVGFSFVDGFIGYIAYDMVKVFEPTLRKFMDNLEDELNAPDLDLIRPKIIIAYAHKSSLLTIVDLENENLELFKKVEEILNRAHKPLPLKKAILKGEGKFRFSSKEFQKIVKEAKKHIKAGDIFQVVPSNRYTQKGKIDPLSFYRILRSKNPSPYLFLIDFKEFSIAGSSPEIMVKLTNNEILLRPIAGTRKRGKSIQRDKELEIEMLNDPKERAEHLMLVDLGRNDVGRVAKAGSVKVPDMMRVERYSHVMHLVSDVIGILREDKDMFDLFKATFTAGTMSGAPKIKAMELIAKFEKLKRGFYSGSVGYFSFNGNLDSAITIRSAFIKKDAIILQAGAGVVADSIEELEDLEIRNKLKALSLTIKELSLIEDNQNILKVFEYEGL